MEPDKEKVNKRHGGARSLSGRKKKTEESATLERRSTTLWLERSIWEAFEQEVNERNAQKKPSDNKTTITSFIAEKLNKEGQRLIKKRESSRWRK